MRVLWLSALVVCIDQATKAAVVNLMVRHESIPLIGDWLRLTFTENPGMAFGLQPGPTGVVTTLAILATTLVVYYLYQIRGGYWPYRASLALILGGALGNIIDRVFYGVVMGYGEPFAGRVVDFIHVSVWKGLVPEIMPVLGGSYMELFPIWNVADMAIVGGVIGILFFQKTFHDRLHEAATREEMEAAAAGEGGAEVFSSPNSPAGGSLSVSDGEYASGNAPNPS